MFEESIEYTIQKSRRAKRLRLAVYLDGSVVVTTPIGIKSTIIKDFIFEKRRWIHEKLDFFHRINKNAIRHFSEDHYSENRNKALALTIARVKYYQERYKFTYNQINIKNQKTRWGSCSKKGNLNFNYKIIFLPAEITDYVIVHEICHLLEFNHSRKFWRLIEKMYPDYTDAKKSLQEFCLLK